MALHPWEAWIYSRLLSPAALDKRPASVAGDNSDYLKFVVFGHQRSGSTLMIRALQQHPHVAGFGELFVSHRISFNVDGFDNGSRKLWYLRNTYPVDFLNRHIFASYPAEIRAVGFKLFPGQLDNDHFRRVWDRLKAHRDLRVIRLRRRNFLAVYVSRLIARATGTYLVRDEAQRPDLTLTIDEDACLEEFERMKQHARRADDCFNGHEVLDVEFEELTADPRTHIQNAQEFLGVDRRPAEITSIRQEVRPLHEIVVNYDRLQKRFEGTEWARSFADT